jgi:hypothetical protein
MRIHLLAALVLAGVGHLAHAEGDIEWRHRATRGAVSLTANPLSGAARTSFYTARGFTEAAIRPYARACGFSFGMRNGGMATLSTRLADWHTIDADGRRLPLRAPDTWDAEWDKAGVAQSARIAFRWAQFQAENVFEPGDWIMGMATLAATPSGPFRLVAGYSDDEGHHEIDIDKLACAKD